MRRVRSWRTSADITRPGSGHSTRASQSKHRVRQPNPHQRELNWRSLIDVSTFGDCDGGRLVTWEPAPARANPGLPLGGALDERATRWLLPAVAILGGLIPAGCLLVLAIGPRSVPQQAPGALISTAATTIALVLVARRVRDDSGRERVGWVFLGLT